MTGEEKLVLIVDDDENVREFVSTALQLDMGVKTVTAEDGRRALALTGGRLPALILTDVRMPQVDGIELIRKLRACPATRGVPIMVMAASACARDAAMAEGATDYLDKPFDMERLLQKARRHLAQPEKCAA